MTINLDTQEIKGKIKFTDGSDGFTSIDNGLLMTQVVEVGNETEKNAFISSVTDAGPESIRFGAGADYAHKNDAVFKVLHNGRMIADNAEIKGKIDADSGNIGGPDGWKITTSTLTSTTGRIVFGNVDVNGNLTDGVMLSSDVYPNAQLQGNFLINSSKSGNNANYGASIFSSGALINTALQVGASGGNINNALEVSEGYIFLNNLGGGGLLQNICASIGRRNFRRIYGN